MDWDVKPNRLHDDPCHGIFLKEDPFSFLGKSRFFRQNNRKTPPTSPFQLLLLPVSTGLYDPARISTGREANLCADKLKLSNRKLYLVPPPSQDFRKLEGLLSYPAANSAHFSPPPRPLDQDDSHPLFPTTAFSPFAIPIPTIPLD